MVANVTNLNSCNERLDTAEKNVSDIPSVTENANTDDSSDITKKEDVILVDESSIDNRSVTGTTAMIETKNTPKRSLKNPLRDLDNLETNPREFTKVKKKLILMTVALASAM